MNLMTQFEGGARILWAQIFLCYSLHLYQNNLEKHRDRSHPVMAYQNKSFVSKGKFSHG